MEKTKVLSGKALYQMDWEIEEAIKSGDAINSQIVPPEKTNTPQHDIEAMLTNLVPTTNNLQLATSQDLLDTTDKGSFEGFLTNYVDKEENQQNNSPENGKPRFAKFD